MLPLSLYKGTSPALLPTNNGLEIFSTDQTTNSVILRDRLMIFSLSFVRFEFYFFLFQLYVPGDCTHTHIWWAQNRSEGTVLNTFLSQDTVKRTRGLINLQRNTSSVVKGQSQGFNSDLTHYRFDSTISKFLTLRVPCLSISVYSAVRFKFKALYNPLSHI